MVVDSRSELETGAAPAAEVASVEKMTHNANTHFIETEVVMIFILFFQSCILVGEGELIDITRTRNQCRFACPKQQQQQQTSQGSFFLLLLPMNE
mmetsp:Transcript_25603/g.60542  ORF Transcript_25603/g.60542 Transcript_25603/m.60542 type:complete len:95 (+) Transcript_25603:1155-1439(+)